MILLTQSEESIRPVSYTHLGEIRSEIEAMPLPPGYTFFWDSQYKDQGEAMVHKTRFL